VDLRRDRIGPSVSEPDVGPPAESDAGDVGGVDVADVVASRRRALGAGIGLAVVVATYTASGFGDSSRWWAAAATILVAVALADLLPAVRKLLPIPGVVPLTIVVALVAIYLCVPETDQVPVAAILPVVVVVLELVGRRQVGLEWYAVAAASVLWAGMFGATGRQSALVGALFAWWAVALLPLVCALRPLPAGRVGTWLGVAVASIGAVAAMVMARTGGIADGGSEAWIAAVTLGVVSLIVSLVVVRLVSARR
jgi:hypothetical protein